MPTENRSSNTEMVSVPRELTQMAADAIDDLLADGTSAVSAAAWVDVSQQLRALLAQPAEQHQGEPVGYVCPRALDAAINGRIGAEQISILKTPYLYINKPLYTHPAPADPGEVERLRLERRRMDQTLVACANERDTLRAEAGQHKLAMDAACGEIEDLRAQLAERDALLSRMANFPEMTVLHFEDAIKKLLSASAEPAKPALVDCGECPRSGGCVNTCMKTSPSAPVERDERAAFEAAYHLFFLGRDAICGEYKDSVVRNLWDAWQARAALERKPSALIAQLQADLTARDELIDRLRNIFHVNNGSCPDEIEGHAARDNDCPACQALMDADVLLGKS